MNRPPTNKNNNNFGYKAMQFILGISGHFFLIILRSDYRYTNLAFNIHQPYRNLILFCTPYIL